jgi:hypothetical protein
MSLCRIVVGVLLLLMPAFSAGQDSKLNWDWRTQEVIGRNDSSIGNTSKLTEPERSSLIDAIVLRLQKPMSDAGYDDDRIREIASTTRIRFVDLGDGKPLLLATSLGLEGGCDGMANCPMWIFRRTDEGFLALLTAIAASYTVQPAEGGLSDLVLMHHITPRQSGLRLYHYTDLKLVDAGCFEASWPKPSDDPTQLSDPAIQPCNEERLNQYGLPSVKALHPHPDEQLAHPMVPGSPPVTPPGQEAPRVEQPKDQAPPVPAEDSAQQAPTVEQPKEQAPAEAPKSDGSQPAADQKSPDASQEVPKQGQAQPSASEPLPAGESTSKPDQTQPAPEQPAPDAAQSAPKSEQPPAEQQPPANQEQPKSDQATPAPEQPAPDAGQSAPPPKNDQSQPPPPPTAEQQPSSEQQPPATADQPKADQAPAPDQPATSPDAAPPPSGDAPAPKEDQPSQAAPPPASQQTTPPQTVL